MDLAPLDLFRSSRYDDLMRPIRVAELFAGVGGFRVGLEAVNSALGTEAFRVVWSNQWEPSTKRQHASEIYVRAFGKEGHSSVDIATVPAEWLPTIDLVVGGFPCQDYSVATTLQRAGGLAGRKGVLWWEIHRILRDKSPRPPYLLLENVDRLLKSPSDQRGRDFAVMLASLEDLGYAVEWRVVNAADYGMPQRRRRVFVLAYLEGTPLFEQLSAEDPLDWLSSTGVMARAFPVTPVNGLFAPGFSIDGDLVEVTNSFNVGRARATPFLEAGLMVGRRVKTHRVEPHYEGPWTTLGDVLVPEDEVPAEFFISGELNQWRFLKGAKVLDRVSRSNGHRYRYTEGGIAFPDPLDRPSRTIITGEGGRSPSRFKHVVMTESGRYRRLVPRELEMLNMFPDDHTAGLTDTKRAFLMGNALVTGIVTKIGRELFEEIAGRASTAPAGLNRVHPPSVAAAD